MKKFAPVEWYKGSNGEYWLLINRYPTHIDVVPTKDGKYRVTAQLNLGIANNCYNSIRAAKKAVEGSLDIKYRN